MKCYKVMSGSSYVLNSKLMMTSDKHEAEFFTFKEARNIQVVMRSKGLAAVILLER